MNMSSILRIDKDNVIYIDNIKENDKFVIFQTRNRQWQVESRKFGYIKRFDTQFNACKYCREQITNGN